MDPHRILRADRRVLAKQLGVTLRTIELWADPRRAPATRPCGRPPTSAPVRRHALRVVRRELRRQGMSAGWRKVVLVVGGEVSMRLVQRSVATWKHRWNSRAERQRAQRRVHVTVLARDAWWAQDAAQVGRVAREAVLAEVVREVATTRFAGLKVGAPSCAQDLQRLLESVARTRGTLPYVLSLDNGGANRSRDFQRFLRVRKVIVLYNVPHVPQHNPFAEHAIGELRAESGLQSDDPLQCAEDAGVRLSAAAGRLDMQPRPSRGGATALQLDAALPRADNLVPRENFWTTTRTTIARAVRHAPTPRARRLAERKAILDTMERFGLIQRTRGGVPLHAVKSESES